jgi:ribosome recycling factor
MKIQIHLTENDLQSLKKPLEEEMKRSIEHFSKELVKVRTGRARPELVEDLIILTSSQGSRPLKTFAVISTPEPRLIVIQPWDTALITDIERAVGTSDLGVTPVNDGRIIRITLPEMSTQRRDELIKVLGKKLEECRVAIRNVRKDFHNLIRDRKKDKSISENFFNRLEELIDKVTNEFIKKAEDLSHKKEGEIRV